MKTRMIGILIGMAIVAALPSVAFAQTNQTGTLVGTVSYEKEPLPGVMVTIKSPAIILPQMFMITGSKGFYRFLSLPPGLYEITFSLDSFKTLIRRSIRISVGQTTTIDAVMESETISEIIEVVGKSPTIDLQSTQKSTNLDKEFLAAMPAVRNLDAYFNMAPGVVAENNGNGLMSSANGSGVRDNSFNLDGVNMTAPDVGTQMYAFGMDIVDEISIVSGGLPAEYGDAMGAAVNVVTRSGENKLSGAVSLYYNSEKLQSDNTAGTPLAGGQSGYKYIIEPGITLGGPLVKDKLWFFTNLSFNLNSKFIAGFPYDQATAVPAKETRPFPFLKLTFQPSQSDRITLSYNYTDFIQDNSGASKFSTEGATAKWSAPTQIFNLQWTKSFSSSFFGNFKIGYVYNQQKLASKNGLPYLSELTTNNVSGGYPWDDNYKTTRLQANANGTYFVDDLAGSHEFKAGVELQLSGLSRDVAPHVDPRNGMAYIFTLGGAPYYGLVVNTLHSKTDAMSLHGYLQDSWKPSKRLTLNLGLRITYQDGSVPAQNQDAVPFTFLGVTFDPRIPNSFTAFSHTSLAPRLGLIYDITGDGKTLFKASFSRYIQSNVIGNFNDVNTAAVFSYYAQLLNPDGTVVPGAVLMAVSPIASKVGWNGSGLKAPRGDELVVALERELFPNWSLSARYTRKAERDFIESVDVNQLDMNSLMNDGTLVWTNWTPVSFIDPYDGQQKTFWSQKEVLARDVYLVNPPNAKRNYDGFELALTKSYSKGWSVMASYVWQNSRGLVGNDWAGSAVGAGNIFGGTGLFQNPNAHINADGQLSQQRRNQFKLMGMVTGPWGINVSGFFRFYSGQPYTRVVVSTDLGIALGQGMDIIYAEPRGSRELPALAILDLRLEKNFRLGGTSLAIFADAFNLLNANTATDVERRSSSAALVFGEMTAIQDPRAVRLGFRFEF